VRSFIADDVQAGCAVRERAAGSSFLLEDGFLGQTLWSLLDHVLNTNIDTAAEAGAGVNLRGRDRPEIGIGNHKMRRTLRS
jgi:hypothetical protein